MIVAMANAVEVEIVGEDRFKTHSEVKPRTFLLNFVLKKEWGGG